MKPNQRIQRTLAKGRVADARRSGTSGTLDRVGETC